MAVLGQPTADCGVTAAAASGDDHRSLHVPALCCFGLPTKIGRAARGRVAEYAAAATHSPLPEIVSYNGKLHLLDTLAAIVSGAALEAG